MNHYKYREQYSDEEIEADVQRRLEEAKNKPEGYYPREITEAEHRKHAEEWFDILERVGHKANSLEVPDKYWDFWFAYHHNDNDFDKYFEEIAEKLAEEYVHAMKSEVESYAWHKYDEAVEKEEEGSYYSKVTLDELLDQRFERSLRVFRDEETLEQAIRTSVALETAIADVNNQGFDKEFKFILDYFKPREGGRDHCFIGKERVFQLLNAAQMEEEKIVVTPENYKNCWWNGDLMVCHIHGEEIDTL